MLPAARRKSQFHCELCAWWPCASPERREVFLAWATAELSACRGVPRGFMPAMDAASVGRITLPAALRSRWSGRTRAHGIFAFEDACDIHSNIPASLASLRRFHGRRVRYASQIFACLSVDHGQASESEPFRMFRSFPGATDACAGGRQRFGQNRCFWRKNLVKGID